MRMIMKVRIFLAITALCLAALPAPAQEYVPTPVTVSKEKVRQNGRLYYSHVVEERQTLYSISNSTREDTPLLKPYPTNLVFFEYITHPLFFSFIHHKP